MSNLPHSLKVDSNIKDNYYKNYNSYKMSNLNEVDNYVCVLENSGDEVPDIAIGLQYRAATSKGQRKDICENKYRKKDSQPTIYIKKDDWIQKYDDLQCGVYKTKDDTRDIYHITGDPRKFPSKMLCDKYKNKGDYDIYTKMYRKEDDRGVQDLRLKDEDSQKIKSSKLRIIWVTYFVISFFLLYWTIKYNIKKPYDFFDFLTNTFINKSLIVILIFGIYLYYFCPFDTCYQYRDSSNFQRNFPLVVKKDFCNYLNNNETQLEESVCISYDNSSRYKFFTPVINGLFNVNSLLSQPFKSLYSSMCVPCNLEHKCIDRSPKYSLRIISPKIITEYENNLRRVVNKTNLSFLMSPNDYLNAINQLYATNDSGNLYDTGTLILLKTNNDQDANHNLLFMASVVMLPTNYEYKWILLKRRSGNMTYDGKESNLKIKMCKVSNRILSVDNNYELIGYNYPLTVSNFINFFEKNNFTYKRFAFFPNFKLEDLKKDDFFNKKPSFIKRKLIIIYKYLLQNPVNKFISPNVSVVNGEYVKYQIEGNDKSFIESSDKLIQELNDIDAYYNDDEDDKDYLEYFSYYKDMEKLNYKLRQKYRYEMIKNKLIEYDNNRQNNAIVDSLNNNTLNEYIIRQHDIVAYKFKNKGILYKCNICKQTCFVE